MIIEDARPSASNVNQAEAGRVGRWSVVGQRLLSALTVLLVILAVASVALWLWPADADLYLPATGLPVDQKVNVVGRPTPPNRGAFYMLFIYNQHVTNKLEELFGTVNGDATLAPRQRLPNGVAITPQQEEQFNKYLMMSSEQTAKYVAAGYIGADRFPVHGVLIQAVSSWSAAWKSLEPGDVIVRAGDDQITSVKKLQDIVRRAGVGARLPLTLERRGHQLRVIARISRSPGAGSTGGRPAIGVEILPNVDVSAIDIQAGDIGGPSAGLAFTLDILQRFSRVDLTHGHRIAVTGEIASNGLVGPIGGVKQKTIGARWAGAEYFIMPAGDNYNEARPYAHGLKLVPVRTLDDALAFLKTLH